MSWFKSQSRTDAFCPGFDAFDSRMTDMSNKVHGTNFNHDFVTTTKNHGIDAFSKESVKAFRTPRFKHHPSNHHSSFNDCSSSFNESSSSSGGGSNRRSSSTNKESDTAFNSTADLCKKILAIGPAPIGCNTEGYCGPQLRISKTEVIRNITSWSREKISEETKKKPYNESDYISKPRIKPIKLKTFKDNFFKELTKDVFIHGPPVTPYGAGFGVVRAALNALDQVERSELETNIRDMISIFPVIGQIELLERILENSHQNLVKSFNTSKTEYMKQGDSEQLATAKSLIDNDFMGDSDPMILHIIQKRER